MRKIKLLSILAFAFAILAAFPTTGKAQCPGNFDQTVPVVTIVGPTGTVYVPGFPADLVLDFAIDHPCPTQLQVLRIDITGPTGNVQTIVDSTTGNPFAGDPILCTFSAIACSVNPVINTNLYRASIKSAWAAPLPGTYTMTTAIKHKGIDGIDTETVTIALLAVEYPAPPAIANEYINGKSYKLNAKQRGCVISRIAAGHTVEAYGPHGGPYDKPHIYADVDAFLAGPCK